MLRIGMIGESEYDRDALKTLLNKHYENLQFIPLLKRVNGTQLDQKRTLDLLEFELSSKKIDALIVQRDLDADVNDENKTGERAVFYQGIKNKATAQSFFLLHIHTLEALIIADLDGFNKRFKTEATFNGNPMFQEKPKKWLRDKCKHQRYEPKDSPNLFSELDIDKLKNKVPYFKTFITELEEYINNNKAA
ncbi:MAG: DUF4276 family protein [Bacteroidota bacterium]|nr:DUF4276 family protein [Bacteroidota bacterium]